MKTSRMILFLVSISILIPFIAFAQAPTNLLSNPGFEQGFADWNSIGNWGRQPYLGGPDVAYEGDSCGVNPGQGGIMNQNFPVKPSTQYIFSAWMKTITDGVADRNRLTVDRPTDGEDLGNIQVYSKLNAGNYEEVIIPFTTTATEDTIGYGIWEWVTQKRDIYIDKCMLYENLADVPSVEITNADTTKFFATEPIDELIISANAIATVGSIAKVVFYRSSNKCALLLYRNRSVSSRNSSLYGVRH